MLTLVEKPAADDTARPTVRYGRTASGRVADVARNQAAGQVFRATRAHGNRPATTPPPPASPTPAAAPTGALDRDGDGVADAQDCGPTDPAIKPGAPDTPDLAFVDSNCDGIDGTETNAIFVAGNGGSPSPGTKAGPDA